MSEAVAELYAELGFKVDQGSLERVDQGIQVLTGLVARLVVGLDGAAASFGKMGVAAQKATASKPVDPPKKAEASLGSLGDAISRVQQLAGGFFAVFAGHQVLGFAHEMMEVAGATALAADRVGLTTDALQELQYAAYLTRVR